MTKMLRIFLMSTLALGAAHAQDPDFKKEASFHNIYMKYNAEPTSAEAWEKALSDRKVNSYTIQNKDTLWDVSQTLFGDPNYWPKVWSYNTEGILNPHEINPGKNIRFYSGTFEEPPTIGLAAKDAEPSAVPDRIIEKHEDGTVEAIKIPPPKKQSRPVVKHLPKSLPLYRLGAVNTPPLEFDSTPLPTFPAPFRYLTLYAVDRELTSVGEVVDIENQDSEYASEFHYITIRLGSGFQKKLVAYDDSELVKDPASSTSATLIQIQGEITVLDRVNESESLYRAIVEKTVGPVKKGAKLVPGAMHTFEVKDAPPTTAVQARVVGGDPAKAQNLFGDDEVIFLSAGAKDGLVEGSVLQVFMNPRIRKSDTKSTMNDRVIGNVKIIKLSDHFATAYVLNCQSDIVIGDYAGGQVKALASAPQSASAPSENSDLQLDSEVKGSDDLNLDTPSEAPPAAPQNSDDDLQL